MDENLYLSALHWIHIRLRGITEQEPPFFALATNCFLASRTLASNASGTWPAGGPTVILFPDQP